LRPSGRLVIIDNRQIESATIFQRTDHGLAVERKINRGTEIESLILDNQAYLLESPGA
jgi:hypothetical protein